MKTARIGLLFALLLSLLGAQFAFGQDSGTYRLQPGDVIHIALYNEQQVNADLPIGKDGNISAPFVGIIRAQGKTTSELEADLTQEYIKKLRIREPKVSVWIVRYRPIRASLIGAVNRPNVYDLLPGDTVITLLSLGGGPLFGAAAELKKATLRRSNGRELIPIDLQAMLYYGDLSQNYTIEDGDELTVPESRNNRTLVLGAVFRPGVYPFQEPSKVMDVIAAAGGPIPIRAMMSRVWIYREKAGSPGDYVRYQVNLVDFIRKGDVMQNILLERGDIVYVTETKTPDLNQIGNIFNTFFFLDRFLRDNAFLRIGR